MVKDGSDLQMTRHAERRRRILEVAADEFSAVGYARATLEGIGARVGLSKAGLYYYVDGKEDLFAQLLERAVEEVSERAGRVTGPESSPVERLRAFVAAHIEVAVTTSAGRLLAERVDLASATGRVREVWEGHRAALVRILEGGIASGELRPVSSHVTAALLFGSLNSIPRWFDPKGGASLGELVDQTVGLILSGIRKDRRADAGSGP
ncbi:MAG: TetR/AcrR family transcriptional regulator [Acidimicrobiia bacterium]